MDDKINRLAELLKLSPPLSFASPLEDVDETITTLSIGNGTDTALGAVPYSRKMGLRYRKKPKVVRVKGLDK